MSNEMVRFTEDMTYASNICVSFSDRAENLNDVCIWFLHNNIVLLTFRYGDTSEFQCLLF